MTAGQMAFASETTPTLPAVPTSSSPATVHAEASPKMLDADASGISAMDLNGAMNDAASLDERVTEDPVDAIAKKGANEEASAGAPNLAPGVAAVAATPNVPSSTSTPPLSLGTDDKPMKAGAVVPDVPEVLKQVKGKLNPVAAKMRTMAAAASTAASTFNERVVPKTTASMNEVREGWKKNVAPGLVSGGARVTSFFGKVGEKMKETNSKLREKNDAFRKVGDRLSYGASSTFEAFKTGGAELRAEIKNVTAEFRSAASDVMSQSAAPARGVPPLARFDSPPDGERAAVRGKSSAAAAAAAASEELRAETAAADAHLTAGSADPSVVAAGAESAPANEHALSVGTGTASVVTAGDPAGVAAAALASAPPEPGGVLNVSLEKLAAWEAHAKPVPYLVMACCHWLSVAGLQTEGIFRSEGSRLAVERLVDKFQRNSTSLIPVGCDPVDVACTLKTYLRSLPEPLLTFSLYTAVVQSGTADRSYMAELTQLLPRARRATLECILALLSRVASQAPINRMDARSLAAALGPAMAWPRSGQLSQETLDRIATAGVANSDDGERDTASGATLEPELAEAAKEVDAVTNALQYLIENYDGTFQSDSFSLDDDEADGL